MHNTMNIYLGLFLYLLIAVTRLTRADPCNSNYGRCDRHRGLCWGTGTRTHFCTCKAGYMQDPRSRSHYCIDIDECKENICGDNAACVNTVGSYKCLCKCGHVMDYTGQRCLAAHKITDMCLVPASCYHRVPVLRKFFPEVPFGIRYASTYLTNIASPYVATFSVRRPPCKCEKGFTFNRCWSCVDVDECDSKPCKGPRSTCTNTEGSYYCGCDPPYVLGPCREKCYTQNKVPPLCKKPKTGVLSAQGFDFRTYNSPIVLNNYRSCAENVVDGDDTNERYDLDHDGTPDVRLSWHCITKDEFSSDSVLKNYAEQEARWDEWSCWTACKATCWGGLQTRSRICHHGLPGQGGCVGNGSEKKECYKGKKCDFRVRKDAEKLSQNEIRDLVQAMKSYKEDNTVKGFHNAASAHGWPFQCNKESCCPHGARMKFITWHRTITLNYEEGISRYLKNKKLGIPYWNWLRDNDRPPQWAWSKRIYGKDNPWTNMTVLIDRSGPMRTIQRDDTIFELALEFARNTWMSVTRKKQKAHIMHEFSESLEGAHGGPHVSVCGQGFQSEKCTVSLATLDYAGFDPLFMLHHSNVDRLWAVSQQNMEDARSTTWTTQTALEALEERGDFGRLFQPFDNETLTPFPIVRATNTMRDSYYYKELTGIQYDSLDRDGLPREMKRALRLGGDERIFIGHYFQSTKRNIYVNYYFVDEENPAACINLNETERMGSTSRLGTSRPFRLFVPHLTPMLQVGENTGRLDIDIVLKACYTADPSCTQRCPELRTTAILSQPDPMTVFHLRNQPVDIHKFLWSEGRRLPTGYVNMHSGSQWIYFHGNRRANIRQVESASDYIRCNDKKSRPFPCGLDEGNACMLPSGVYYLIDADDKHCKNGLRMIVVSRK